MVQRLRVINIVLIVTLLLCSSLQALAKPLVTGWHKILINQKHSGYLVQEYKFDKDKKEFSATNFAHITLPGARIDRSLQAKANHKLEPISFQYTEKTGDKVKLIDASFEGKYMNLTVNQNGNKAQKQVELREGTFLGIFLYILMITNKKGIKEGHNFSYYAIAEDTGEVHVGKADVTEIAKLKGLDVFKVLNKFAGSNTVEHVTPTGQIVNTLDPNNGVATELVQNQTTATGSFPVSQKSLELLFGAKPLDSFPAPIKTEASAQ